MIPKVVKIREVGPRDGFQNEPEVIPTETKIALIDGLSHTGLKRIELTSFVRPDVIPQLADAQEVLQGYEKVDGMDYSVLIPNMKGMERVLEVKDRVDTASLFMSASETHNQKNVNRSVAESLEGLKEVLAVANQEGMGTEAVISVSFGCPYEGKVDTAKVCGISAQLIEAGCTEIGFGDTTGMANPVQVKLFFTEAREALGSEVELTAHFHNTRGQGLANALAALEAGCDSFESSFGELGGCPVPKGATGNIASEDLVAMLHEMGIETGIDLGKLVDCARAAQEALGRPLGSHLLTAGPIEWN